MERQQFAPVARGSFGEHTDDIAGNQMLGQLVHDPLRVAALLALQEHRIELEREPAHHGPLAYFRLRDETRRPPRVDHIDVDPRNMIGDDQRATVEPRAVVMHDELHPTEPQHFQRPRAVKRVTLFGAGLRKARGDHPHTVQQMRDEAELA